MGSAPNVTQHATSGPDPGLQEDLERELDRAAPPEQVHGRVQVHVVARSEDERALGVVPRPLELLVTPPLDSVDLGVQSLKLCRRHTAALRRGDRANRYSSSRTYRSSPFWGDSVQGP